MTPPTGASAVLIAAEALRTACTGEADARVSTMLHDAYDRVLIEPVPVEMQAMLERIERGKIDEVE